MRTVTFEARYFPWNRLSCNHEFGFLALALFLRLKPLSKMRRMMETKMNKFLIGAVGLVAMATSASAADLGRPYTKAPPPMMVAMYDWSGFYIGLNGGGGWSHKCWDLVNNGAGPITALADGCHDATGGTF